MVVMKSAEARGTEAGRWAARSTALGLRESTMRWKG
jgi:hypothetical protein